MPTIGQFIATATAKQALSTPLLLDRSLRCDLFCQFGIWLGLSLPDSLHCSSLNEERPKSYSIRYALAVGNGVFSPSSSAPARSTNCALERVRPVARVQGAGESRDRTEIGRGLRSYIGRGSAIGWHFEVWGVEVVEPEFVN